VFKAAEAKQEGERARSEKDGASPGERVEVKGEWRRRERGLGLVCFKRRERRFVLVDQER